MDNKNPVSEAKMLLAHETVARYIKNHYDAFIMVGFTKAEAFDLAKTALAEMIRNQQKAANEQLKGKSHGTGNI